LNIAGAWTEVALPKANRTTNPFSLRTIGVGAALGIAAWAMPAAAQKSDRTQVEHLAASFISPEPFDRDHDNDSLVVQSRASFSARHDMGRHDMHADHRFERRERRDHTQQAFSGFLSDSDWPYWNGVGYGSDYCTYGGCGEIGAGYGNLTAPGWSNRNPSGPGWNYGNHSLPLETGSYVGGQPSALVLQVAPQEGGEHDRAWIARCEPHISFDGEGVPRYYYNSRRGCASGQWAD
jgi:hypothetical protein